MDNYFSISDDDLFFHPEGNFPEDIFTYVPKTIELERYKEKIKISEPLSLYCYPLFSLIMWNRVYSYWYIVNIVKGEDEVLFGKYEKRIIASEISGYERIRKWNRPELMRMAAHFIEKAYYDELNEEDIKIEDIYLQVVEICRKRAIILEKNFYLFGVEFYKYNYDYYYPYLDDKEMLSKNDEEAILNDINLCDFKPSFELKKALYCLFREDYLKVFKHYRLHYAWSNTYKRAKPLSEEGNIVYGELIQEAGKMESDYLAKIIT